MIEIPLTRGYIAIVDDEDADLSQYKWQYSSGYARRKTGPRLFQEVIYIHRVILSRVLGRELTTEELVDHKDTDGLNNRRSNLRLADKALNNMNRGKQTNNTSGYKGVSWFKLAGKWRASLSQHGKNKHLGLFGAKEEAARAYNEAAKEIYGEFAYQNVIEED